jgi:hypothetical protein
MQSESQTTHKGTSNKSPNPYEYKYPQNFITLSSHQAIEFMRCKLIYQAQNSTPTFISVCGKEENLTHNMKTLLCPAIIKTPIHLELETAR